MGHCFPCGSPSSQNVNRLDFFLLTLQFASLQPLSSYLNTKSMSSHFAHRKLERSERRTHLHYSIESMLTALFSWKTQTGLIESTATSALFFPHMHTFFLNRKSIFEKPQSLHIHPRTVFEHKNEIGQDISKNTRGNRM